MVLGDIRLEIAVLSVGLAIVSRLIQARFGKRKEVNEIQQRVKQKQERLKELMKKEDTKSKNEAQTLQTEMMTELNTMMSYNMRVMFISLLIFGPALALLQAWYQGMIVESPISIPVFHRASGFPFFWLEITTHSNWFSWYFWWTLLAGIILGMVFKKLKIE